jgi:deazaflavin-dependent oxidoreductase (nitroreductase family)
MPAVSLSERFSVWAEVEILSKLTPKNKVGPLFKWIFKIPVLYYKLSLGWMIGKRFLLLTTTGRKTGKTRHTPLEYEYDPREDWYRISPGWGGNTDWYKNILKNPHVSVQVGRRRFDSVAESVPPQDVANYMMTVSRRHPTMDKVWNRWSDKPVDGSFESYVYAARYFPSIRLRPRKQDLPEVVEG